MHSGVVGTGSGGEMSSQFEGGTSTTGGATSCIGTVKITAKPLVVGSLSNLRDRGATEGLRVNDACFFLGASGGDGLVLLTKEGGGRGVPTWPAAVRLREL